MENLISLDVCFLEVTPHRVGESSVDKCVALAEDLSSDLRTHIGQLATACNFSSEGPLMPSSALVGHFMHTAPPPNFKNKMLWPLWYRPVISARGGGVVEAGGHK